MARKIGTKPYSKKFLNTLLNVPIIIAIVWIFVAMFIQVYCYSEWLVQSNFCYSLSSDRMIGVFLALVMIGVISVQAVAGIAIVSHRAWGGSVNKSESPIVYWIYLLLQAIVWFGAAYAIFIQ